MSPENLGSSTRQGRDATLVDVGSAELLAPSDPDVIGRGRAVTALVPACE